MSKVRVVHRGAVDRGGEGACPRSLPENVHHFRFPFQGSLESANSPKTYKSPGSMSS